MEGYWSSLDGSLLILLLLGLSSRNSALYSQPTFPHPTFSQCNPTLVRSREATLLLHLCQATFPHPTFGATLHWSKVGRPLSSLCQPAVANWLPLPAHCQHIASTLPTHCQHIGDIVGVRRHQYTQHMSWKGRKQTIKKSKEKTLSGRHDNL